MFSSKLKLTMNIIDMWSVSFTKSVMQTIATTCPMVAKIFSDCGRINFLSEANTWWEKNIEFPEIIKIHQCLGLEIAPFWLFLNVNQYFSGSKNPPNGALFGTNYFFKKMKEEIRQFNNSIIMQCLCTKYHQVFHYQIIILQL